ncbi:MAG: c-type cytochrome [Candidatus Tectomicrobia bacterium]|nr:c-type cytochrome [Candidatus Tectomicrobia bacterium]
MRLLVVRWMVVSFLGMVGAQPAQGAAELAPGQELYQRNCGQCHGTFDQSARHHAPTFAAVSQVRLAVALPYGPSLRGVVGRAAGTVQGFSYSRAFRDTLKDVVWTRGNLDRWLTNSQQWVPGSRMFYKQPDPDIRRQIITYLEAQR